MTVLGFDEYYESHTDGLQILRYNLTKAYTPHMDYLDNFGMYASDEKLLSRRGQCIVSLTCSNIAKDSDPYDYDSSGTGGNRFATILLYMSDLKPEDGGETVFAKAPPAGTDTLRPAKDVIREMRETGSSLDVLNPGSWEEEMAAHCKSRLAVTPYKSRAVLFYSQVCQLKRKMMSTTGETLNKSEYAIFSSIPMASWMK